jgi:hypothetical protein
MPRDGSGIYTKPFPDVVAGTTIESAVHNGTVADVETDLNAPRPIVAGGTGASNVSTALFNLGAEKAAQLVTNYNSHVFVPGSFRSAAGAAGAPNGTDTFAGTAYINEPLANPPTNQNVVLEARNTTIGHLLWVRAKVAGAWTSWNQEQAAYDARYVDVAGDTMTGVLTVSAADGLRTTAPNGQFARTVYTVTGTRAWSAGVHPGGTFTISDDTAVSTRMGIDVSGNGSIVGSWSCASVINSSTNTAAGYNSRTGLSGTNQANFWNFSWGGGLRGWVDTTDLGLITFTSDYRVKKDVTGLPDAWEAVKGLRPVRYTQAEFSPPSHVERAAEAGPMFVADDLERWGFIAHELQETLIPSAATGVKDDPDTIQSPNPWTVIAALTSALQEAMARIEALEAGQPP